MAILEFPNIELATPEGLLAFGGDLEVESLLLAYRSGIFPWPTEDLPEIPWFSPDPRGILPTDSIRWPKSFLKFLKKSIFSLKFNTNFSQVISQCSLIHRERTPEGVWITKQMIEGYTELFNKGYGYSIEVYNRDKLVGGLYGVCIGSYLSAESMFYIEPNASKFALYKLTEHLKERGIGWIDTQMVTPIVESLGGIEIKRKEFINKLAMALSNDTPPFSK